MTEVLSFANALLPKSLLRDPDRLGGQSVGDCLNGDLTVRNGRIIGLSEPTQTHPPRLVMPPLAECHVHLDKCFTFSRLSYQGGDLSAAIEAQALDRAGWTAEDIRQRATRAVGDLLASGCRRLRTHVDWSYGPDAATPPLAWHVLAEVAEAFRGQAEIQLAPLVSIEDLADRATADAIARICAASSKVLGAFVLGQAEQAQGIENAFAVAKAHDLALDFHVDETLDPSFHGLELIADAALAFRLDRPVLCGHACNLATKPEADRGRIIDKLARAGITIAVLPTTNLYLQGRGDPMGRGMAPVRALQAGGVPVVIGTDNVEDAFFPLGRFDPRAALELAVSVAHLDPPFGSNLPMITTSSEKAMGFSPSWIDQTDVKDLLVYDVASVANFITSNTTPAPLRDALKGAKT